MRLLSPIALLMLAGTLAVPTLAQQFGGFWTVQSPPPAIVQMCEQMGFVWPGAVGTFSSPSSSSVSSAAALPGQCFSSDGCPGGQYCSTEDGDCRSACGPWDGPCIQACAGICKPRDPTACAPHICPDGTQHPSCGPDGHPIHYFAEPCLTHQGSSSSSIIPGPTCATSRQEYDRLVASNKQCTTNADCTIFSASCPYLTCGEAVRQDAVGLISAAADFHNTCRSQSGEPISCAGCLQMQAVCQQGQCTAQPM